MFSLPGDSSDSQMQHGQACLTLPEAERLVMGLKPFDVDDVGSAAYLQQHKALSKLNLQAHANVQSNSDEFITEMLVLHDKVTALVRELLVIEAWKAQLLPRLRAHLSGDVPGLVTYFILYQEAVLANLLELVLYHQEVAEAMSEDALLELVDWAARQLTSLAAGRAGEVVAKAADRDPKQLLEQTPLDELEGRVAETSWAVGLAGLTIARHLSAHAKVLPLGVAHRLLRVNDYVLALVPLLERPPWVMAAGGKVRKWLDNAWRVVPPADRYLLTPWDAQAWLALTFLVADPSLAAKQELGGYRGETLLRLRSQLHERLLDQLPPLHHLASALDQLALGAGAGGAGAAAASSSLLVLEQVPQLRASLVEGRDWEALAATQRAAQFGPSGLAAARRAVLDMSDMFDLLCALEPAGGAGGGQGSSSASSSGRGDTHAVGDQAGAGSEGSALAAQLLAGQPIKVDCSRKVQAGLWEHWASFTCRLDPGADPTPISVKPGPKDGAAASSSKASGVSGTRYKLQPLVGLAQERGSSEGEGEDAEEPPVLPPEGKVVVRCGSLRAEALLSLPAPSSAACIPDAPAGLWLTCGLLAADGLALQLRLRRHEAGKRRDRVGGCWAVYQPVGGALSLEQLHVGGASSTAGTAQS